jgi:hypothetical protein
MLAILFYSIIRGLFYCILKTGSLNLEFRNSLHYGQQETPNDGIKQDGEHKTYGEMTCSFRDM